MKLLVAIANHGTKSRPYLDRLLQEYRSMPYETRIVILSDTAKDFGPDVEVRVGTPIPDPWSLPFGHKAAFAEHVENFDLFIYTEDDMLITDRNIRAFLHCCDVLPEDEIAGFMQSEQTPDGRRTCPAAHYRFHWHPGTARERGGQQFAMFSNVHAACYILSQAQLKKAIGSGGFLVPPHNERFDYLVTAATDPYVQCGLTKLVCISQLEDFIIPHLPNRYAGKLGMDWEELRLQADEMVSDLGRGDAGKELMQTQTSLPRGWLSKSYYGPLRKEILERVPISATNILSVGCGTGDTEQQLVQKGYRVFAIPLDRVIGSVARSKGVHVSAPALDEAEAEIGDERFDCVLCDWVVHLWPDPVALLKWIADRMSNNGTLIACIPNVNHYRLLWSRLRGRPGYKDVGKHERSNVQMATPRNLRRWLKRAGLELAEFATIIPDGHTRMKRMSGPIGDELLATDLIVTARRAPGNRRLSKVRDLQSTGASG